METGDSSEYPSDYDDALLCYASYILFNQVQKYDNATVMRTRYEEAVNAIKMKVFPLTGSLEDSSQILTQALISKTLMPWSWMAQLGRSVHLWTSQRHLCFIRILKILLSVRL